MLQHSLYAGTSAIELMKPFCIPRLATEHFPGHNIFRFPPFMGRKERPMLHQDYVNAVTDFIFISHDA